MNLWPDWYSPVRRPQVDDIIHQASRLSGIMPKDIRSLSRRKACVRVRQAICLVAHENKCSLSHTGRRLSRNHSTVITAIEAAKEAVKRDPVFATFVTALRRAARLLPVVTTQDRPVFAAPGPIVIPRAERRPASSDATDDELLSQAVAAHYAEMRA